MSKKHKSGSNGFHKWDSKGRKVSSQNSFSDMGRLTASDDVKNDFDAFREERFTMIAGTMLEDAGFQKLRGNAVKLYIYAHFRAGNGRDFSFPQAEFIKLMTAPTFYSAMDELVQAGFVEVLERNKNIRKANKYRLSDNWQKG